MPSAYGNSKKGYDFDEAQDPFNNKHKARVANSPD